LARLDDIRIRVVKPFDIASAFIEQHERKRPLDELKSAFGRSLHDLGIRHFACCSHVDPLSPPGDAVVFQTYPQDWVRYFSQSGLYLSDPVFRYAGERVIPFSWDDADFRASLSPLERRILREAREYGIAHGYTVPIHPPRAQTGSCSVVPDSAVLGRLDYQAVFTMAYFMYDALVAATVYDRGGEDASVQLSERERQCVELAAQGKDDWSIGSILRISERTAHNHIERAKRRFGVSTRVQVIVRALRDGQISFGDVIKSRARRPLYSQEVCGSKESG
jgi:LuxR family quorum-sensing system transcriptional regulator CciR